MVYRRVVAWIACALTSLGCGSASDVEGSGLVEGPSDVEVAPMNASARTPVSDGHAIRLSWPAHRGQRGRFRSESEEATVKRLQHKDGSAENESTMKRVVAKGIYEVFAVSSDGRAVGVLFEVDSLSADFGARRPAFQLERAQVRIERAERLEDAIVTVDGRPADEALRDALDAVLSLTIAKAPSDDEIFGTRNRQRIGASWPIQAEVARQSLGDKLMRVPEGAVSGEMRLVAVDKNARTGIECQEIVGRMEVSPFEIVDGPPGAKTERARIVVLTRAVVPLGAELPHLEDEMTMSTDITMSIPGAGLLELTSRKATHSAYEPL